MKNVLVFLGLYVVIGYSFGQETEGVPLEFNDAPIAEILQQLEGKSEVTIYFDPDWFDTLSVDLIYQDEPLGPFLEKMLEPLGFHVLLHQGSLYITRDVKIIDELPLAQAIRATATQGQAIEKGLIFSRDYLREDQGADDLEQSVFQIGQRSKMVVGGKSNLVGYITEKETGNPVMDAVVYVQNPTIVATTDLNGFYSINLPVGRNEVFYQYAGLKPTRRNIVLFSDGNLNVDMSVNVISLKEVLIESDRDANIRSVSMGVDKIDVKGTKNVPIVLGERDVMKVATTFAGVQTAGEGSNGFNVRGGKSDQNLIRFNGAPVYNASHFLGFFSVFNSDVIENMEVYKASIPARLGGRLASVFDIEGKKADLDKFSGRGAVSPVTSKLALEIPVIKEKSGLIVGGRSTYSNWILRQTKNANFNENRISFSDFNLQYDHKLSDTDDLQVSAYLSADQFRLNSDTLFSFSNIKYSNQLLSVSWKKIINNEVDITVGGYHSGYGYDLTFDQSVENAFRQDFDISDTGLRVDGTYYFGYRHTGVFGVSVKQYQVNPGSRVPFGEESEVSTAILEESRGREMVFHFEDQVEWNDQLGFSLGLRYSLFQSIGAGTVFTYDSPGPRNFATRRDSIVFQDGEVIKTNGGLEFRAAIRYAFNQQSSIKASFNQSRQYIHTLTNSGTLSPTDTWALTGYHLRPQLGNQWSVGYFQNFKEDQFELSIEGYYKKLKNLVDFKVGTEFLLNDFLETVVLQGPGKSYGLELALKKRGKLNGWFNYTYARTFLKLDSEFSEEVINEGAYYPTSYDKPHTINLVSNYKATRRISFSFNLNYSTGRPITAPVGTYDFKGNEVVHFSDRNTFRIPDYLRMDIGVNLEEGHLLKRLTHAYWAFSIYNVLGRDNPYSVFFDSRDGEVSAFKLVVFGNPIPTLSFNFRF